MRRLQHRSLSIWWSIVIILLATLLVSGCRELTVEEDAQILIPTQPSTGEPTVVSQSETIAIIDGMEKTINLNGPAQRVVSMAPSNTEILFAVGAGEQVVGRDAFSDYPEEALDLPDIGGSFGDYNLEAIVELQPDLVLAAEINTQEQVTAIEALGLTVFYLSNPVDMEGMYGNLQTVGRLTGHEMEASALVETLRKRVEAAERRIADVQEMPLVFYEIDATEPNAPYTAGEGTFIHTLIEMAGGRNLGAELDSSYGQFSLEELVVQDPDVILLGNYTWGGVTPEDVAARPGWEELSAVRSGQVYTFDDNLVSRPGPRLVEGLENMVELLHGE